MADEILTLDHADVATARTALVVHTPGNGIRVKGDEGPDYDDATIAAYLAEQRWGDLPVDFRIENRKVTLPLIIDNRTSTFATNRRELQRKVALIQAEGGYFTRTMTDGTKIHLDVVDASLKLSSSTWASIERYDSEAELVLTCLPDWYGAEITLTDRTFISTATPVAVETGIKGDYPGRARLTFDNDGADDVRGMVMGVRSKNYDSSNTAALFYDASGLLLLDTAGYSALPGALGGSAVIHANLMSTFTPILSTQTLFGQMTHKGTYRLWVRAYTLSTDSAGAGGATLRFVYSVGDLANPEVGPEVQLPAKNAFYLLDLGTVRIEAAPVGTHYWRGEFQGKGAVGGESVYIDTMHLIPADEGYIESRAPLKPLAVSGTVVGRDGFESLAVGANLNARVADIGGSWASTASGAGGSTTDYQGADQVLINPYSRAIQRATVSDGTSGGGSGRLALFSTVYGEIMVQGKLMIGLYGGGDPNTVTPAVVARYVDSNNFLQMRFLFLGVPYVYLRLRLAGVESVLAVKQVPFFNGVWLTARLTVYSNGVVVGQVLSGNTVLYTLTSQHTALVTGGALDDGKFGVEDYNGSTVPWVRQYDDFLAMAPPKDAVVFAGRSSAFGWDGAFRQGSSVGAPYQPLSQRGDNLRIPPAFNEARSAEFIVRPSAGDLDQLPDYAIQAKSWQIKYRPCWLFTPEA